MEPLNVGALQFVTDAIDVTSLNSVSSYCPRTIPLYLLYNKGSKLIKFTDQILPSVLSQTMTAGTKASMQQCDLEEPDSKEGSRAPSSHRCCMAR